MAVPISQMWTVATYVLRQKFAGRSRYPLVLMLEPLFRCNLACLPDAAKSSTRRTRSENEPSVAGKSASKRSKNAAPPWSPSPAANPSCTPEIDKDCREGLIARKKYIYLLH